MLKSLLVTSLTLISLISCSESTTNQIQTTAAKPIPITIYISGMTCQSCNNAVDQALGELEGVTGVEADYITGKATMQWQSEKVSADTLLETVNKLGYQASLQPKTDAKERAEAKLRIQSVKANLQ